MFAIEYALTTLWRSWGVAPAAVIGHSVGEYAAACAAGVFSLEDGLRLIAERGRLMQSLPPGGMMAALFAPIDEIEAAIAPLRDRVAIAAINAPGSVVISGETSAVETVLAAFARRNVIGQRLFVSLAAHSPLVEPALDRMEALARSVAMSPPSIPIAWNLTGRPLPNGDGSGRRLLAATHARAGPFRGWRQGAARRWLPDFPRGWAASDAAGPGATIFAARTAICF